MPVKYNALKLETDMLINLHKSLKRKKSLNLIYSWQNQIIDIYLKVLFTTSL